MITAIKTALGWAFNPTRRRATFAVILLCVLAGAIATCSAARKDAREQAVRADVAEAGVTTLETAREADEAVLVQNTADVAAIRKDANDKSIEIDAALAENPEWADQPVPDDLVRSLRD